MHMLESAKIVLIVGGIWQQPIENEITKRIYYLYSKILLYYYASFTIASVLGLFFHGKSFSEEQMKHQITYAILDTICLYKWLRAVSPKVQDLITEVDTFSKKMMESRDTCEKDIFSKYCLKVKKINIFLTFLVISLTSSFHFVSFKMLILEWDDELIENGVFAERPSQLSTWPFFPQVYYLNYVYQTIGIISATISIISPNCLYASLIISCIAQLDIFSHKLRNFEEDSEISDLGDISRIGALVQDHQQVIRFVKALDEAMKTFMLMDLVTHSLQLAIIAYQLITMEANVMMVFQLQYFFLFAFELLVFYWNANEVYLHSIAVADAIYSSMWYNCSTRAKKLFLTMIQYASQRPLYLTAGSFFPLKTGLIIEILRGVYSLVALVKKIDKN